MLKEVSVYLMSFFYINIGIKHFTNPDWLMPIMPPYLPFHIELIYISGVFEIILGLGLIFKATRYWSAWGLILLLIAVYPANIFLAFNAEAQREMNISHFTASWIRLPLQFIFIGIAYWHSKQDGIDKLNNVHTKNKITIKSSKKETKKIVLSWLPEVPGYQVQNEVSIELEESQDNEKK